MRKYDVPVAFLKPYKTLKNVLVHPEDKQNKEEITECVYKVPCANCDKTCVDETERKFGVRLQEHRTEVEAKTTRMFTKSTCVQYPDVRFRFWPDSSFDIRYYLVSAGF